MRLYGITCLVGPGEGEIKAKTVAEVIANLCASKGEDFKNSIYKKGSRKISNLYLILVNGARIDTRRDLGRKVKKGDVVAIVPDLGPCC